MELLETLWIKHTFNSNEIVALAQEMSRAQSVIADKTDELKSAVASIKAEIAMQETVSNSCAKKLCAGYEMLPKECVVTYDKGIAKYVDKHSGEVLQERGMTEEEQLKLTEKRIDAETVIREASANEE